MTDLAIALFDSGFEKEKVRRRCANSGLPQFCFGSACRLCFKKSCWTLLRGSQVCGGRRWLPLTYKD